MSTFAKSESLPSNSTQPETRKQKLVQKVDDVVRGGTNPSSQDIFSFLKLPAELKNMIYSYSLDWNEVNGRLEHLHEYRRQNYESNANKYWRSFDESMKALSLKHLRLTTPPVLLVNKQITKEALGCLYEKPFAITAASLKCQDLGLRIGHSEAMARYVTRVNFSTNLQSLSIELPDLRPLSNDPPATLLDKSGRFYWEKAACTGAATKLMFRFIEFPAFVFKEERDKVFPALKALIVGIEGGKMLQLTPHCEALLPLMRVWEQCEPWGWNPRSVNLDTFYQKLIKVIGDFATE